MVTYIPISSELETKNSLKISDFKMFPKRSQYFLIIVFSFLPSFPVKMGNLVFP